MKTFTASHLSHKPAEVLAEAKKDGAIIHRKNTNGDVMEEYLLMSKERMELVACYCHHEGFDDMGDIIDTYA